MPGRHELVRDDGRTVVFDEVGAVDKDYPGLALERGLLFESTGRSADALKAYEGALAKAPNDADLMLRVGCGNVAAGRVGPNLTHIASRSYIAAGSLPKTREHLEKWILDPQKIKPGIRMPMNNYAPEDLAALVEYLESLK